MNGARDEFLPCPGFAFDEDSRISERDRANEVQYLSESPARTDDFLESVVYFVAVRCAGNVR